jgi:hypothetical protein
LGLSAVAALSVPIEDETKDQADDEEGDDASNDNTGDYTWRQLIF